MRLLIGLSLSAAFAFAQSFSYNVHKTTSLGAAVEKITVQQPASAARKVIFEEAYAHCSAACTITFSRNGTAATATSLTVNPLSPNIPTAKALGWSGSDAGAGTTISPAFNIAAAGEKTFNLAGIFMDGNGTGNNLSMATDSITATVKLIIRWREE